MLHYILGATVWQSFLTGDSRIGLKYANHPRREKLQALRIFVFEAMVGCANQENCDLFVISEDLFERARESAKRDIKQLMNTLSRFYGTVAILPGNHDYYG